MPKTVVPRSDVQVGQTIWASMHLAVTDIVTTSHKSTTAKLVRQGKPVDRIAIVLRADESKLEVAYMATFNRSGSLAHAGVRSEDMVLWYPVQPSPRESKYEPLVPKVPSDPVVKSWVALSGVHEVTTDTVEVLDNPVFDKDTVQAIIDNMVV